MKKQSLYTTLHSVACGIASTVIVYLFKVIWVKFTNTKLSLLLLLILFFLIGIILFLSMKYYATKKELKRLNGIPETTGETIAEINDIYSGKEAFCKAFIELLPNANTVDIFDLRGFFYTQQDSPLFHIISTSQNTTYRILLSDPDSKNTIYRANNIPNKPVKTLKNEIRASIDVLSSLRKDNVMVKLCQHHNVTRLIFVDNYLFLTPFRNGDFLASAPTFKIPNSSALYKCYKDYFSEMWRNQSIVPEPEQAPH